MKKLLLCLLLFGSILLTSCGSQQARATTLDELYTEIIENATPAKVSATSTSAPGTWVDPAKLPTASDALVGARLTIPLTRGASKEIVFAYSPSNEKGKEQLLLLYSPEKTGASPIVLALETSYGSMAAFLKEKDTLSGIVHTVAIGADDYPYNLNALYAAKEKEGKTADASSDVAYGMWIPQDGEIASYIFDGCAVYTKNFERTLERFHIPAMKKS